MTDEERWERFRLVLAKAEIDIKGRMVEIAEEELDTGSEKVGLLTALSLGLAAAALHSAREAVEQRGEDEVGELALMMFNDNVAKELRRLVKALGHG